jgi:hypothetical protein
MAKTRLAHPHTCRPEAGAWLATLPIAAVTAVTTLLAASCFTPTVIEGQFQCESGDCPRGLECSGPPAFQCVLPGTVLPVADGGPPAPGADGASGSDGAGPGEDGPGAPPGDGAVPGDGAGADGGGTVVVRVGENLDDDLRNVTLDTTVDEVTPDLTGAGENSMDARADTNVSSTGEVSYRREFALLRFDLARLQGSQVLSAELRLHVQTSEDAVRFHEMVMPWDANATYNQGQQGMPWPTVGCEGATCYRVPEFAQRSFDLENVVESVPIPAELVQRWIDDASSNHGMMIRIEPGETSGQVEFSTSEASNGTTFDGGSPDLPGTPDGGADLPDDTGTPGACGNGIIDPGETCDTAPVGGATCQSLGFRAGTLRCASDCQSNDDRGCSNVVFNEIESNPSPDWIELYNPGPGQADLSGYTFSDADFADPTHVYTFPAGTVIPEGGFLVRIEDVDFTFGLGASDRVILNAPGGGVIDEVIWTAHAPVVLARCPDGGDSLVEVGVPTQGVSNAPSCP